MAELRWNRRILGLVVAAGMVAGCGGAAPSIPVSPAVPADRSTHSGGALLYTAHAEKGTQGYYGVLSAYGFPGGKPVSSVRLPGFGTGLCSDSSGNVWVVVTNRKHHDAYEFAHGGTTPIAKIHIEHAGGLAGDCAVDPTTGNLAVLVGIFGGSSSHANAEIWAGARGKPTEYPIYFQPAACAYDANGDLFVDGYIGSTVSFELAELVKGGPSFARITVKKDGLFYPGGLAWDGQYLDVVTKRSSKPIAIYRVSVSGSVGHVAGVVMPQRLYFMAFIAIDGNTVAGMSGANGHIVSTWPYPHGGKATKNLVHYGVGPRGLTISL
jgi:hypothetical protein